MGMNSLWERCIQMKNSKQIIINAFRRQKKNERGLNIIHPDKELANAHIGKSRHNLTVMNDLNSLKHTDWVVVVAYYAMYHAATAVLSRIGLDSKDHATTVAVLDFIFNEHIDKELLEKFNKMKEEKENIEQLIIEEKILDYIWSAKNLRETAQYGTNTFIGASDKTINQAKEFVLKIRALLDKLSEDYVNILQEQVRDIYESI